MGSRRDLVLLLGSAAVSSGGSSLTLLAVLVHLRPLGPGWVAAAQAAQLLPVVALAPVTGPWVDRVRSRPLLLGSLLLQAGAVLLAATAGLGPGLAGVLLVALALVGAGSAVTGPTVAALVPHVAGEEGATRAYGWYSSLMQAGFLAGFAVAGVLVAATSVRTALVLDAASYAVMAAATAALRTQRVPSALVPSRPAPSGSEPSGPELPGRTGRWSGFVRLHTDRVLLAGVAGMTAAVLASVVVNVADVFFVLEDLGAGPGTYGWVTACWPAAGVVAGWAAGRLVGARALLGALAGATAVMGVGLATAGAVVTVGASVLGWVLGGGANAVQRVAFTALVRARTPDAERGRVFAASSALFQVANATGLAVGAGVVGAVGARGSLVGAGVLTVLVGAGTWAATRQGRSALA